VVFLSFSVELGLCCTLPPYLLPVSGNLTVKVPVSVTIMIKE
jgi:hypothetical protein